MCGVRDAFTAMDTAGRGAPKTFALNLKLGFATEANNWLDQPFNGDVIENYPMLASCILCSQDLL